jgi:crotonobetainyl-CoA:carnitine CoA-transferase CaiB-like acyl-CoA transferase
VARDPHILHRNILLGKENIWGAGFPVKFSDTPASVRLELPELGAHTNSVLEELGYSKQQIDKLL